MKSDKIESADTFWQWFEIIAPHLSANIEDPILLAELDDRLARLAPMLSWEVGPGVSKPYQLVISPNLNRELRQEARSLIAQAPVLDEWEFHSARQPKDWDYKVDLGGDSAVSIDASEWTFVLLRYPDGSHEVVLHGEDLPALDADQRQQVAAVVLESIVGEEVMLDRIAEFDLVDELEPRFAKRQRPIQVLRVAMLGARG